MDYYDARHYLDAMPLPILIADRRSGHVLFANAQAKIKRFGSNVFSMIENANDFSSLIDSLSRDVVECRIDGQAYHVRMAVCSAVYRGTAGLLITVTSMTSADTASPADAVLQICSVYTDPSQPQKTQAYLRISGESVGAFCVSLYEKSHKRYVLKDEWRQRKSVCVPVLRADITSMLPAETARLRMLKRAKDAVSIPYTKQFGTQGIIIYYFDRMADQDLHTVVAQHVDIFKRLSSDAPGLGQRSVIQKGLNALDEGIAVWDFETRKLLLANKAYRLLFGYADPRRLCDVLGHGVKRNTPHAYSEEFTDLKHRYFKITHYTTRQKGRTIVTSIMIDMTAQKKAEKQLEKMARKDALTGLDNRRAGIENLRRIYAQSKAEGQPLTVCFADIDGLKYINDTYGHGAGDSMIRAVGDVLKCHVAHIGSVCRLGGDEFVLILPGIRRAQAAMLTAGIERDTAKCLVGKSQGITMSFGFKEADYGPDETADTLVNVADYEMYREKRKKSAGDALVK
jgi:diguanylate cyclase (GGDEF)-like protein